MRFSRPEQANRALEKRDAEQQLAMDCIKADVKMLEGDAERDFYYRVSLPTSAVVIYQEPAAVPSGGQESSWKAEECTMLRNPNMCKSTGLCISH